MRNEELGIRNEELGIRNEGGGFAANIYGRCPKVCDGRFPSYRKAPSLWEGAARRAGDRKESVQAASPQVQD